jgi:hypothetical protein
MYVYLTPGKLKKKNMFPRLFENYCMKLHTFLILFIVFFLSKSDLN